MTTNRELSPTIIFAGTPIAWGRKYPREKKLDEIWAIDRGYLIWGSNLDPAKRCDSPLPAYQRSLVELAFKLSMGNQSSVAEEFAALERWRRLAQEGEGLAALPRPSVEQCQKLIRDSTILAGHNDLDGIYSVAIALAKGGALSSLTTKQNPPFSRIRILKYGLKDLAEYTARLAPSEGDKVVVIDFAAHPGAALNLDHHSTSLCYWEFGTPPPTGIFDPSIPSCPRLLSSHCGIEVDEAILAGCDMIDGAIYDSFDQAFDLKNPFVALALALDVDTSEVILKKTALTLAAGELDPQSVLGEPIWKARVALVKLELEEQARYWTSGKRITLAGERVSIADALLSPYPAHRYRYSPFMNEEALDRPYLITLRPSGRPTLLNIGVGRNPFYKDREFYNSYPVNIGAMSKSLGGGGGRVEVGSFTIPLQERDRYVRAVVDVLEQTKPEKP